MAMPALFIAVNVLEYELGIPIAWSPFHAVFDGNDSIVTYVVNSLIVYGPVLGMASLLVPLFRVRWKTDEQGLALTVSIRKTTWIHLGMTIVTMMTIAILGAYLLAENLLCLLGQQIAC